MKIQEIDEALPIIISNEEQKVLEKVDKAAAIESFSERDRFIIESLIRKSLILKIKHGNSYLVARNA